MDIALTIVVVLTGRTLVTGQTAKSLSTSGPTGSSSEQNRSTEGPTSGVDIMSVPLLLLVIASSIAGAIIILSATVCVCHCVRNRKRSGILDIEASSEFHTSDLSHVTLRPLPEGETTRRFNPIASFMSWGSEFIGDGARKGNYENVDVIKNRNRKSRGNIYANTFPPVSPEGDIDGADGNKDGYINVQRDVRPECPHDDVIYTAPLPQ